jgi:iron complex transport system substrate-binding protein
MNALVALLVVASSGPDSEISSFFEARPTVEPGFLEGSGEHLERPASRIVTVAPSVTEIVFALGGGGRVIGVSRYDDHPPEVKGLPRVGGFLDPSVEAILELRPGLIIGVPTAGNRPALERLARLKVPVLVVPGNSFADIFHATRAIARVLGGDAEARAEEMLRGIERDLVRLSRSVSRATPPKVAFVYGFKPLVLAGPGSFADSLLRMLHAKNVVSTGSAYPQYSVERLLADQPDVIIDASEAHEGQDGDAEHWSRFTSIPAVKNRRVHRVRLGDLLRPGPRIVEGMKRIALFLYPR